MTINARIFALAAVIILSVAVSVAQTTYRDVIYLKSGSVIKGTIIETVPEKSIKIETADGNVFVYNMSEIEKITKEAVAVQIMAQPSLFGGSTESLPSLFSIFGGAAIPVGDFASETDEEHGFAKTGFTAGVQFVTGGQIGFLINASYASNPTDLKDINPFPYDAYDIECGSWTSILLLTGLKIGTTNPTGVNFFFAPLIGMNIGMSPKIEAKISDYYYYYSGYPYYISGSVPITGTETYKSATSTAFAYGATAEAIISGRITIGARYIACKPTYDIDGNASYSGYLSNYYANITINGTSTGKWKREQSTSLFLLYVGVAL
jgi:hypothetical protein